MLVPHDLGPVALNYRIFTINGISANYGKYHWFLDFDWLWSSVAMVLTIVCRDTINCKASIVLCNGPQIPHYLGEKDIPLTCISEIEGISLPQSGIGLFTIGNYRKHPLSQSFSGNLPKTTAKKKILPFLRKWEHACGPLMHSSGGGGGAGLWIS